MNESHWDWYDKTLFGSGLFLTLILLTWAWLIWSWRRAEKPRNHFAYASVAFGLLSVFANGSWVCYGVSAVAVLLAMFGFMRIQMYRPRHSYRPMGGKMASGLGLGLGLIFGGFTLAEHWSRLPVAGYVINPFSLNTPADYEDAILRGILALAAIVLAAAWLGLRWWRAEKPRNHFAYASMVIGVMAMLPVEHVVGSRLSAQAIYQLSQWTHWIRYGCGALAVFLAILGIIQILVYRFLFHHHRPMGGRVASGVGLVLGLLIVFFTYAQRLWPVLKPSIAESLPYGPSTRGGYVIMRQAYGFGLIVPASEWAEELPPLRSADCTVELTERSLHAHTRFYVRKESGSLLEMRDQCVADLRRQNPALVIEKEENLTINTMEAIRLVARATQGEVETCYFCTVLKTPGAICQVVSWSGANVYSRVKEDIEFTHANIRSVGERPKHP